MTFKFVSDVDKSLFDLTRGAWLAQLEANPENTSATYYGAGLDFCERTIGGLTLTGDGGGCVCAVIEGEAEYAAALVIVSHAKAKRDLRMLDIYIQPVLNLADQEPKYAELAWIAATAIVGCLELTYEEYPSRQLKLHTAVPLDATFMSAVTTAVFGHLAEHYEVSSAGTWIVVTKRGNDDAPRLSLVRTASE